MGTHNVSQQERTPPHGAFCTAQLPAVRQRPTVGSHEWLQQSVSPWQRSPSARQKFMNAQRPVAWPLGISQKPEQQLLLLPHDSPSVVQPEPRVVQMPGGPPTQLSSQQAELPLQALPDWAQLPDAEQTPATHDSEQQSAAWTQLWPGGLHSPVCMQRKTPAGSLSHKDEQQAGELDGVHRSPTRRQALAACSHLPPTQLALQQSVLALQLWW